MQGALQKRALKGKHGTLSQHCPPMVHLGPHPCVPHPSPSSVTPAGCVTLDQGLTFPEPQLPHLQDRNHNRIYLGSDSRK